MVPFWCTVQSVCCRMDRCSLACHLHSSVSLLQDGSMLLDQWLSYRISAGNGAFLLHSSVSLLQTFHPSSNRLSACNGLMVWFLHVPYLWLFESIYAVVERMLAYYWRFLSEYFRAFAVMLQAVLNFVGMLQTDYWQLFQRYCRAFTDIIITVICRAIAELL
jgi:hypothetical protein